MTAFSRAERMKDGLTAIIEIRSYNSRNLDLSLHVPHAYSFMEDKIRSYISSCAARGRIGIHVEIKNETDLALEYQIDGDRALAYYDALSRLKETLHIDEEISLDLVLGNQDIIKPLDAEMDTDVYWKLVEACLHDAMDKLDAMRKREGDFLAEDLMDRLDFLDRCIDQIEGASENLTHHYQERLKERIARLTRDTIEIDPDRIAQEAAFLADKSDISEEIVRVKSHIQQFREIVDAEEPAGRKLNFLLQEFNREFNTIGSKTGDAGVPYRVVDAKAEIEKMREQVQNVE